LSHLPALQRQDAIPGFQQRIPARDEGPGPAADGDQQAILGQSQILDPPAHQFRIRGDLDIHERSIGHIGPLGMLDPIQVVGMLQGGLGIGFNHVVAAQQSPDPLRIRPVDHGQPPHVSGPELLQGLG